MKGDVGARTGFDMIGEEGIVEGCESLVEARPVRFGRPFGGPFGSLSFEHAAKFEHVLAQIGVLPQHVLPGIEET